ncbi:hypothetical protein AMAG_11720 [Allomyces macrogynus ATCC 38327]|uniref:Chitin-binding type-4 domain-containing protein n=1 Tax=Allomyces macrogynus (strain ATCC 38327) TaxID=578462 RepID=A0A0L0SVQ9_ALLM3|nr:hypothetical protein AMAG_11720 [Allomyces macrogynus ATCC 38327]|eukprot:KNE66602.1 hypothetical protein AMAG_11720 [Allomyces macrogynus ATCC 38327]
MFPRPILALALLFVVALVVPIQPANAHSRLLSPPARDNDYCGAWSTLCAPCGKTKTKADANPGAVTYKRGQTIDIANNHPAGFIRLSIVPFTSAQTIDDFTAGTVHYSCHESGCKSGNATNPNGPDAPGTPVDGNRCSTKFTVPTWLKDGQYTLQWLWFGGASYYGDENRGQTDYYSCHDFTVRGGVAVNPFGKPSCPTFFGGDAVSANTARCKYFGTGAPFQCRPDGCAGSYKDGRPVPLVQCLGTKATTTTVAGKPAKATAA